MYSERRGGRLMFALLSRAPQEHPVSERVCVGESVIGVRLSVREAKGSEGGKKTTGDTGEMWAACRRNLHTHTHPKTTRRWAWYIGACGRISICMFKHILAQDAKSEDCG